MKQKENQEVIQDEMYKLIVPVEILNYFEISEVMTRNEEVEIELCEKTELIPKSLSGKEIVSNGFMNPLILQHFPVAGKRLYLKLIRRRWKVKGDLTGQTSCQNDYDFTADGTKATKTFGAFLKENF